MYSSNFIATPFFNGPVKATSAITAGILNRLATGGYPPARRFDKAEWDPSRDEKVAATTPSRWGAVGERQAARDPKPQWQPRPQTGCFLCAPVPLPAPAPTLAPAWPPFKPQCVASLPSKLETKRAGVQQFWYDRKALREEQYLLTESFNPFNPVNVALRAAEEVSRAAAARMVHRLTESALQARLAREVREREMERNVHEKETGPFETADVARRAAAEARFEEEWPVMETANGTYAPVVERTWASPTALTPSAGDFQDVLARSPWEEDARRPSPASRDTSSSWPTSSTVSAPSSCSCRDSESDCCPSTPERRELQVQLASEGPKSEGASQAASWVDISFADAD
ncbi:hypothetical protein BV20DRAFT_978087 [Pilatotrama ljubarskyi]|nr:hypothetical protein BV20DRAFT_978087 [Pilatotrama ljubarskyi]